MSWAIPQRRIVLTVLFAFCICTFLYFHFFFSSKNKLITERRIHTFVVTQNETKDETKAYRHVGGKPCSGNTNREVYVKLLSRWHSFAEKYGIEYTIAYGSLLGQYRDKDVIPWDGDVDVMIHSHYYQVLKTYSDKRDFKQGHDSKFHLVVQPEFKSKAEDDRQRWNCDGKNVTKQVDSCSFIQPMGRLVYSYSHLDIFHFDIVGKQVYDPEKQKYFNRTDYYPLRQCRFMDVLTWCPNKKKKILEKQFGNIKPSRVCKEGKWVS